MVAPHLFSPTQSPVHEDLAARKAALRQELLARRAAFPPGEAAALAAEAAAQHLLASDLIPEGAVVSAYWPMGAELDPRPAMLALRARGHVLVLPVTPPRGQPLIFRRWAPEVALREAPFGLREPPPEAETLRPDLLLVPLLGFDRHGQRLGYGAGYYDRTLEALPGAIALGFAYAAQEVSEIPAGPGDRPLGAVITEHGLISVAAGPPNARPAASDALARPAPILPQPRPRKLDPR